MKELGLMGAGFAAVWEADEKIQRIGPRFQCHLMGLNLVLQAAKSTLEV